MDDFVQFLTGGASKSPTITNVGNIRPVGSSTGFQQFDTPEAGIKAVDDQLRIYGTKHKVKTLREVISRYAPPSENDTESYIKNVSQRTGLKPDEEIDLTNPTIRHIISGPIILQEQGLQRLKGTPQTTTQQPQTQPQSQTQAQPTDDFVSFLTQKPEVAIEEEKVKPTPQKVQPVKDNRSAIDKYVREPILAVTEPPLQAATALGATAIGNVIGAVKNYGERGTAAEEEAAKFAEKYTYEPRGKIAQKVLPKLAELSEEYGINKVTEALPGLAPELTTLSQLSAPVKTQLGAKVGNLSEQFAKRKAAETAGDVNKSADILHDVRLKTASELPVPVKLTAGQASQDPVLISRERNERGFKEAHAERFNEQNKALQENAIIIKQNSAPNVLTTDYVADADNLIDTVKSIKEANKTKTQEAYKALEDAAGGKFPIDGVKFAKNAIEKLVEDDKLDYLPATIKNKLDAYASGSREMNFNLFENLRSELAAEMRKADRAGDGNMKRVLSLVRDELENLPMQEGDAALKALADNARKTAKADFDLEKSNPLYNKVLNESADSKDLIQTFVIRSKNADFMKSIELLKDDPVALEHLRSGTMDYIIRESTDASGNFSTGKFQKLIENLNVNKKLDALFGENSKQLKDLAEVAKIVESRPKGSFVNESNTATAIGSAIKEYGSDVIKDIPIVKNIVNPASRILRERKIAKEVKQSLNPQPKTKLSDIGK
jgi:hypothetical protein